MEYIEQIQNITRPIFLNIMQSNVINFNLQYEVNNANYNNNVKIICP
jgi:hypothetical protein